MTEIRTPGVEAAENEPPWAREQFIPIRTGDLIERLAGGPTLPAAQRESFRQFCQLLTATFHHEFHSKLEELKGAYAPFDPDADTHVKYRLSAVERQQRADELFDRFQWLLERANFRRLTRGHLQQALAATSDWGLQLSIDFDMFDRLEVFSRGDVMSRKVRRRWRNFNRPETVDVPIYQRLVVIFRLHSYHMIDGHLDGETIHLKVFKNIPKADLEMLLPGSRVKMSVVDRGRILLPTVSGVAIAGWKLFQGAVVVAVSGFAGLWTYLGLIAGTLGYGIKSFFGYLRTQQKYQLSLTRSLYYQNLDNNAGVLFRLFDEAEEQECREAILAYFFLWRASNPLAPQAEPALHSIASLAEPNAEKQEGPSACGASGPRSPLAPQAEPALCSITASAAPSATGRLIRLREQAGYGGAQRLDREIEAFLLRETGLAVDFEVGDALRKLQRLGLVTTTSDGLLQAVPIDQALELLDRAWDNLFRYNQDASPAAAA